MEPTLHNESLRIIASLHHDGVVQAIQRNELVAALADAVLVPYAAGGKSESTAKNILALGQRLFTFADENNEHLLHAGAEAYELDRVRSVLQGEPNLLETDIRASINSENCWGCDATEI